MSSQLSPINSQRSVELHIEELVLYGFAPGDRYSIGDSVERELARLFGKKGVPILLRSENATNEITGASFNTTYRATPPTTGRQIAHAVYQRISQ